MTPAHQTSYAGELVCSNSFGNDTPGTAPAQLKWEAQLWGQHLLKVAYAHRVPAGQALAVDRDIFAKALDQSLNEHPNIQRVQMQVHNLDELPRPCIIATGPLTSQQLSQSLAQHFGDDFLYFFDAIAPIISTDSIDMNVAWKQSRYDKGTADYINCPLNKLQYEELIQHIQQARKIEPKAFEITPFFEGCMPIEVMVERGPQTLRFGPMKPVGLKPPGAEREPYAVVQLRQDNKEGTAYNMVGFQTRMAYGEQTRVFRMIPGLENAEFLKLGSIHRNLFINSPWRLNRNLSSQKDPNLFFAGQITGVEGYFESTCIGQLVAHFVHQQLQNQSFVYPPRESAFGSILESITSPDRGQGFQPTNINFGLFPEPNREEWAHLKKIPKEQKRQRQIEKAQSQFRTWLKTIDFKS